MSIAVLDIETVPDLSVWTPPEVKDGDPPPFPPPAACRIVCVAVCQLDKTNFPLKTTSAAGDETEVLQRTLRFLGKAQPNIVTWAGRVFDLPVIAMRAMRAGLPMPWYYRGKGYRYRYSDEGHLDLCDALSDYGASRFTKMDVLAKAIGLPGKMDVKGDDVASLWGKGEVEKIADYCTTDVAQTAFLYLRYLLQRGDLTLDEYRMRASALLSSFEELPATAGMARKVDRNVLLLPAPEAKEPQAKEHEEKIESKVKTRRQKR